MRKILTVSLIVILALVIPLSIIAGSYVLTSNHVKGTPNSQATLTLTANATATTPNNVTIGDTLMLTAHVSDNSQLSVTLTNNGASATTKTTDSSGNAVFYEVVTSSYDFVATATHP